MTDYETKYRDLVAGLEALADEWANQDAAYWHMLHEPDVKRAIEAAQYALAEDFHALLAPSPAEGTGDPDDHYDPDWETSPIIRPAPVSSGEARCTCGSGSDVPGGQSAGHKVSCAIYNGSVRRPAPVVTPSTEGGE